MNNKYMCLKNELLALFRAVTILLLPTLVLLTGCEISDDSRLFQKVDATESGISFSNDLAEAPDFNILNYLYFYDGGGVSIGDINNDGLADV